MMNLTTLRQYSSVYGDVTVQTMGSHLDITVAGTGVTSVSHHVFPSSMEGFTYQDII